MCLHCERFVNVSLVENVIAQVLRMPPFSSRPFTQVYSLFPQPVEAKKIGDVYLDTGSSVI